MGRAAGPRRSSPRPCIDLIEPLVYGRPIALIDEHHAAGRDVVIVVGARRRARRADRGDARRRRRDRHPMVVEDGRYTGEVEFYAYGEHKAAAMRELAAERGLRPRGLLRLQRLGHRRADARARSATPSR